MFNELTIFGLNQKKSVVQNMTSTWEICHTPVADMQRQYNTRQEYRVGRKHQLGIWLRLE